MSKITVTIWAFLFPGVAAAHPEHTSGGHFDLVHYLTDPFHVALAGAAVLVFLAVRRSLLGRRSVSRAGH